jgi:hypothetical protein
VHTDYIFCCPSATEFDLLESTVQQIIVSLGSEWPSYPMVGTKEVGDRKLLHVRMTELLTINQLFDLFSYFNLDWQVFSIRSAYKLQEVINDEVVTKHISYHIVDKTNFLPYINDIFVSETTHRTVEVDDAIYLSTYAGTEPLLL